MLRGAYGLLVMGILWAQAGDTAVATLTLSSVTIVAEQVPFLKARPVEIAEAGQLTLGDNLATVPGVEWMQTGIFTGRPVVRGHSYTRVLWLLGGLPREGAYWGEDHGYEAPPTLLTFQPEVWLGPQSVRYGSDALGGVVRLQPLVPTRPFFKGYVTAMSNPLGGIAQVAGAVGEGQRFLMGEVALRQAGNYFTPRQGFVWNTGLRAAYGYLTARLPLGKKGFLETLLFHTHEILGLPSTLWDPEQKAWFSEAQSRFIPLGQARFFQRDLPFQRISSSGGQLRLLWNHPSGHLTTVLLGGQRSLRREYAEDRVSPDVLIQVERIDADISHVWRDCEGGFTGNWRLLTDVGQEPFLPRVHHAEGGVWLRRAWTWGKGRLWAGGRLHGAFSASAEGAQPRLFLTWAAEAAYQQGAWIGRLTRSFRIPHVAELWAEGFHAGAQRYEYGRASLPTEVAWTAEVAYVQAHWEVRPYIQYFPRYIFVERLPDSLPTAIGAAYTYGVRQACLAGIEIEARKGSFSGGAAYVWGTFLDEDKAPLPKVPPFRLRLALSPTWRRWLWHTEVLLYAAQPRAYTAFATEIPTPGYGLWHTSIRWRWLTVGVQNLLGTRYQPHLSAYRQWVPGGIDFPGRAFFLRVGYPAE